jgi:hypothetical protein
MLGYGSIRLLTGNSVADLRGLALWLVAAVAIHDGLVSPTVLGAGSALRRMPPRARRFTQAGLVVGGLLVVVAAPLIYRQDSQPPSKALLVRDYGANLSLLLGLVAAASLLGYLSSMARARSRPDEDGHESPSGDR